MEERTSQLEIKTSRNGLTVPVINGIHLHSIYNPAKEAEAFALGYEEAVSQKNNILILGLGYGYHVDEIAKLASKYHENYNILVIEPNKELVEHFMAHRNFQDKNINITYKVNAKELYEDISFVNFLMQKPCIIKHDSSFNLDRSFYTEFLKFQAPNHIGEFMDFLDPELQTYFKTFQGNDVTLDHHIKTLKAGGVQDKMDFGMLAFEALIAKKDTRGVQ